MTREEAYNRIDAIIARHEIDDEYVTITSFLDYDALRMARKALGQEPCEDAISRQAVLELADWFDLNQQHFTVANLKDEVENMPSVQPKIKTGYWIKKDGYMCCDKCGYVISTFTANIEPHTEYKYCPNCGAKM